MKHLISIIIVNWDGEKYLRTCIPSLANAKTKHILEIVVVDNGSKDDSLKYLKSQALILKKKKIKLLIIENKKNTGFAHANNQGFKASTGDLILFLNNDTKVTYNFLDPLVDVLISKNAIAGVQPKLVYLEDHSKIDSVGSFFTKTGILFHRGHQQKDNGQFEFQDEVFSMKGACMLFKRKVLSRVGLFDDTYFAYFEETDLCHRVWLAGFEILYVSDSTVYHKVGGSTSKVGSPFIQFHSFKNRIQSYLTNFEAGTLLWLMPVHIFLSLSAAVSFLAIGKPKHFTAVLNSFMWVIINFNKILKKRKYVQNHLRKVSDKTYLEKITVKVPFIYFWYLLVGGLDKLHINNRKK